MIAQTPEGYSAESVCRLTRKGDYVREDKAPHWYFIVPVEGVRHIEVTGDFGRGLTSCSHANEDDNSIAFDTGERVFLRCLDGFTSMGGLSFKAFDRAGGEIFSFNAPVIGDWNLPEENRWGVARLEEDDPVLLSEQSVAMQFLTRWFTPDYEGRYTRLLSEIRGGNLNEKASDSYFSAIRPCVTEEYYKKIVMNRGYHSYDKNAAENDLTNRVRIPSVRLNYNGDGTYAFKVYLDRNFDGAVAVGTLRFKDGKVDGMYVNDCTLGKERRGGGETLTSFYYEDGETTRYEGEWTTAVPPEEYSGADGEVIVETTGANTAEETAFSPVDMALIELLDIRPALLPLAERDLRIIEKYVDQGDTALRVNQALTYPAACAVVVTASFSEKVLQGHRADRLSPSFTLTADGIAADSVSACSLLTQGEDTAVYAIRLFLCGDAYFTTETRLTLSVDSFSDAAGFTVTPREPLTVSFSVGHVGEAKQVVFAGSSQGASGFTGVASLTPLSLTLELTEAPADASWQKNVGVTADDNIPPITGSPAGSSKDGSVLAFSLSRFIDPDKALYLFLGEQRIDFRQTY